MIEEPKPPPKPVKAFGKLEPEYAEGYEAFKSDPSPQNTGRVLEALQPVMQQGIRTYIGRSDPVLMGHAKQITLSAIKTYDPRQAKLRTHVLNHLQGLQRVQQRRSAVVRMPERQSLARYQLYRAETELEDTLGRTPSTQELSENTGLSVKRIAKVRQAQQPVAEGTFAPRSSGGEVTGYAPAVRQQQHSPAVLDVIYEELNPRDQNIMEWTLGLHGRQVMSTTDIARKLRLTPGAVSQRKARIQAMMDENITRLES